MTSSGDPILLQQWQSYETSDFVRALLDYICLRAPRMQTVETVICCGLGPVQESIDPSQNLHRNSLRYRIALRIGDIFQEEHANKIHLTNVAEAGSSVDDISKPTQIAVIVQNDSMLSTACVELLQSSLGITVAEEHLVSTGLQIGAFVIGKQPKFNANTIAVNGSNTITGVAGLMCDPIGESDASKALAT